MRLQGKLNYRRKEKKVLSLDLQLSPAPPLPSLWDLLPREPLSLSTESGARWTPSAGDTQGCKLFHQDHSGSWRPDGRSGEDLLMPLKHWMKIGTERRREGGETGETAEGLLKQLARM